VTLTEYLTVDERTPTLFERNVFVEDADALAVLVEEYVSGPRRTVNGDMDSSPNADAQNFFLFWLPNRLTNMAMEQAAPTGGTSLDLTSDSGFGRGLWMAHLCGYYFGVWLRLNLTQFDRPRRASEMTDDGLAYLQERFVGPLVQVATIGTDEAVLAESLTSLRRPITFPKSRVASDLVMSVLVPGGSEVGIFGFDTSWLRHILPPSRNAPHDARPFSNSILVSDKSRLLDATYAIPEERFLVDARIAFAALDTTSPDVARRLHDAVNGKRGQSSLLAHQRRWNRFATALYARGIPGGTVYRGVDQQQYDRLLTWASYSCMIPQAAAFNALVAHATQDADLARRQTRARALWWALVTTYCASVADPRQDDRTIAEAFPALS
jgi:hypothetical protein